MNNRVFSQVDYRQFRQFMTSINTGKINEKGFETAIYDKAGDIQAIIHAASMDEKGRCYPAEYFIRTASLVLEFPMAA